MLKVGGINLLQKGFNIMDFKDILKDIIFDFLLTCFIIIFLIYGKKNIHRINNKLENW